MAVGSHETTTPLTVEWLTPPYILEELGKFDLDPCAPIDRPWNTAAKHYTIFDNGLTQPWEGRVWLNPPYGRDIDAWLARMADHGNGIALIFARTETAAFHQYVWNQASALFFFRGRLQFWHPDGRKSRANAGAPSCLVAYNSHNANVLDDIQLDGKYIRLDGAWQIY